MKKRDAPDDETRLLRDSDTDIKHKKKKKKKEKETEKEKGSIEEENGYGCTKNPTVTIAVAGSIIDNAQSHELATLLAGQIARAFTIFRIDEVVVFDNIPSADHCDSTLREDTSNDEYESGAKFLVRILQYLETPQYLRRRLFPMHDSLKFVGILPPLDAPHHVRKHEWCPFREGLTLQGNPSNSKGTIVDVGLSKNIVVEDVLEPGKRVTVAMGNDRSAEIDCVKKVVPSSSPKDQLGMYWGYKVRYASNLSCVFKNCPYEDGYDYKIGTSEHGLVVSSSKLIIPSYRHLLIVFGGLAGLEESIEEDNSLKGRSVNEVFDSYLNTCPLQGSRTIRTEEAVLISLQYFQAPMERANQQIERK